MPETIAVLIGFIVIGLLAWDACNGFALRWGRIAFVVVSVIAVAFFASPARAHDPAQPELDAWYMSLKQPDSGISCCGPNDSYWCSEGARGSQVICTIDDDRDDKLLGRHHIPNGTVIEIPPNKINKDPNPTGRAVVFMSTAGYVWCFVGISGS